MRSFPFISQRESLVLLRVFVSLVYILHAVVRLTNGTVQRFAGFLDDRGLVFGFALVCLITTYEILGGMLMAFGRFTPWVAGGFILQMLGGIAIIHAPNGWFTGEHGSGGAEYATTLIAALLVIAAYDWKET